MTKTDTERLTAELESVGPTIPAFQTLAREAAQAIREAQRQGAGIVLAEFLALMPIAEVIPNSATTKDLLAWFRGKLDRLAALEAAEPVAYLRDVDGTGSLHPCAEGDPGAIAVYER